MLNSIDDLQSAFRAKRYFAFNVILSREDGEGSQNAATSHL